MKKGKHVVNSKGLLFIGFLLVILLNFLIYVFFPVKEKADKNENRARTEFPVLKGTDYKAYFDQVEGYFDDHFKWKYDYIEAWNRLRLQTFHYSNASKKVILGKDGWLFLNACVYTEPGLDEYCGLNPWSENQVSQAQENLNQLQRWCDGNKIIFIPLLCPNKHSVYPEFLPDIYVKSKENRWDQLMNADPDLIDLRKIFLNEKNRSSIPLYYKTDTHWNDYGSYFALMEISKRIHAVHAEMPEWNLSDIEVSRRDGHEGQDLANMMVIKKDVNETFVDLVYKSVPRHKLHRLFIVHDSFFEAMRNGLNRMFDVVDERGAFVQQLTAKEILDHHPDVFIYEHVERYLDEFHGGLSPDFYSHPAN